MDFKVDSDLKRICAKLQIECCRQKNPIPHLSVIVSLKQTTKVCIQQSNSEKDDKYNTESRRYSCIFTYGTNSGTGEVFRYRETFNTLISV